MLTVSDSGPTTILKRCWGGSLLPPPLRDGPVLVPSPVVLGMEKTTGPSWRLGSPASSRSVVRLAEVKGDGHKPCQKAKPSEEAESRSTI